MNIWLIYPYGSVPGEGLRPDRGNIVADVLSKAGHQVTWWGSAFEHRSKTLRSKDWKDIEVSPTLITRLVPTNGYEKNISFRRIQSEKEYAKQVYNYAHELTLPDMIIMGEPALFISKPIIKLVKETKALFILDMADLWPELFHIILPRPLNKLGKFIFLPLYLRRKALFKRADAIIAVSNSYLNLAKSIVPNLPAEFMETVFYGMNVSEQRDLMKQSKTMPLALQNIKRNKDELWAIYASTLGNNYDLDTLLEGAKLLEQRQINLKVIIAGAGPLKDYLVSYIKEHRLKNIVYIGHPNSVTMASVYNFCDIGLSMYLKTSTVSIPIKAYHYFAAGLPVINSLEGDLALLLSEYNVGLNYKAEDTRSFVNVLQELTSDLSKLKTMAKNSFDLANLFDIDIQYKKFLKLVEHVEYKNRKLQKRDIV